MDDIHSRRTLALAGVFQAAGLVRDVARQGHIDRPEALEASVASVFATDPDSVAAVFGGPAGVRYGLELLAGQLRGQTRDVRDTDLPRYVIGLTVLERKLARQQGALEALGSGIEAAQRTYDHFGAAHPNVHGRLADLYSEHVSPIGARIMVRGAGDILNDADNVAKVRALLLAGLRAAVLWRQQGGRRYHLLFSRNRYLSTADALLAEQAAP
ncbi:MAG TPA: high frequency lysogenization protein HflD [Gammaproteobacteria bacterium]|nr:high frequency lysogenization protein HflD [Gammaproteobacteria bacterium]